MSMCYMNAYIPEPKACAQTLNVYTHQMYNIHLLTEAAWCTPYKIFEMTPWPSSCIHTIYMYGALEEKLIQYYIYNIYIHICKRTQYIYNIQCWVELVLCVRSFIIHWLCFMNSNMRALYSVLCVYDVCIYIAKIGAKIREPSLADIYTLTHNIPLLNKVALACVCIVCAHVISGHYVVNTEQIFHAYILHMYVCCVLEKKSLGKPFCALVMGNTTTWSARAYVCTYIQTHTRTHHIYTTYKCISLF